jgi:hypothetical protein
MIELQTECSLSLTPKRAAALVCHAGVLWLTREGDVRDLFLARGDRAEIGRGLTLVTALEPSVLSLLPPRGGWRDVLRAWLPATGAMAPDSTV